MNKVFVIIMMAAFVFGCTSTSKKESETETEVKSEMQKKVEEYAPFKLTTDLSVLSENQKEMLPLLFEAAKIMDRIFWMEAFGDKDKLFTGDLDKYTRKFLEINYGPWERLKNNEPFLPGYGEKPAGANFYPEDMTKEEFEAWDDKSKTSQYTLIRRGEDGNLKSIPYHIAFEAEVKKAADLINQAVELDEDTGFKNNLEKRV